MRPNNLSDKGLSMSQAQSISNVINQKLVEIDRKISPINNFTKTVKIDTEVYTETQGVPMPPDIIELLQKKAKYAATLAFLRENVKAKEAMLTELSRKSYSSVGFPELEPLIPFVNDDWAIEQLTTAQINELLEAEAYAAHIGQFIHKDGKLDLLRKELPNVKLLEFISVKSGEKTPVKVQTHHTSEELLKLHEDLATIHRDYEKRVNYYKANLKNAVTLRNAEINRLNGEISERNNTKSREFYDAERVTNYNFEAEKEKETKAAAALRINVDSRFQPVIDEILGVLGDEAKA
jgi:hypothetical protein